MSARIEGNASPSQNPGHTLNKNVKLGEDEKGQYVVVLPGNTPSTISQHLESQGLPVPRELEAHYFSKDDAGRPDTTKHEKNLKPGTKYYLPVDQKESAPYSGWLKTNHAPPRGSDDFKLSSIQKLPDVPANQKHNVMKNEYLGSIAKQYTNANGSPVTVAQLKEANASLFSDPKRKEGDLIKTGEDLRLPPGAQKRGFEATPANVPSQPATEVQASPTTAPSWATNFVSYVEDIVSGKKTGSEGDAIRSLEKDLKTNTQGANKESWVNEFVGYLKSLTNEQLGDTNEANYKKSLASATLVWADNPSVVIQDGQLRDQVYANTKQPDFAQRIDKLLQ